MFAPEVLGPTVDRLAELAGDELSNLLNQAEQVTCFRNAARRLVPGGRFVIELWVPELRKLPPGRQAVVFQAEPGYIGLPAPGPAVRRPRTVPSGGASMREG